MSVWVAVVWTFDTAWILTIGSPSDLSTAFIRALIKPEPADRLTVEQALRHPVSATT